MKAATPTVPRFVLEETQAELRAANQRLEEFHEILQRKNAIIRLLSLGDCTAEEFRLSDGE